MQRKGNRLADSRLGEMARYEFALEQTPARHNQRLLAGKTVNAHLTTVCEFSRFCAAQGHIPQEVADRLVLQP
ncbi:hypothetical protein GCM10010266_65630 [Streptomyces griseomycini]|nr:hypothetical protein GCM10010266_65630 [Streptomyces griseomycini]